MKNLPTNSCLLAIVLLFLVVSNGWAQCNCKFTIPPGPYTNFDGAAKGVKAGDVICIGAGNIQTIVFSNIVGAPGNPVIIKNCGGQALIGGPNYMGIIFKTSKYIHITGTGDPAYQYGIKIVGSQEASQGLAYGGLSTDGEIDHIEVANAGYAGIMAKTDPTSDCNDVSMLRPNFTLRNMLIHDNYVHDTRGEGVYMGNSFYSGSTAFCGSMQYPHEVRDSKIYNNRFENTGQEAIQVGSGVSGIEIYNNVVHNSGALNIGSQNGGIQLGAGTAGRCYGNYIEGGPGPMIAVQGIGNDYVYDNVLVNPGAEGITLSVHPTPLATDIVNKGYLGGVYIVNNTFINPTKGAVVEWVSTPEANVLANNLVVNATGAWDDTYKFTTWTRANNIAVSSASNAKFVNAGANDYHLAAGSPAIDAGANESALGVTKDFDGKARPSGSAYDVGAFEYSGTSTGKAPLANAGSDKSVTLPTSTLTLSGSGTDSDGTIASYAWTKVSGPAATLTNANSSTLSLSVLVAGTYVFRLTVTDNSGLTGSDDVTVTVITSGKPPVVSAGADKSVSLPLASLSLAGTASDPDGTIANYAWTKQSGPGVTIANASTATVLLSALVGGTYVFRLTVTDNSGLTAYDEVTVVVSSVVNIPPVVSAGPDVTLSMPYPSGNLNGVASDPDGTISTYAWTQRSGLASTMNNSNKLSLNVSKMTAGTYVYRLTVTDNKGATAYDEATVTVTASGSSSTSSSTSSTSVTGKQSAGSVLYRVNAGGSYAISDSELSWSRDSEANKSQYLDGGSLNYTRGGNVFLATNNTGAPDSLFGPNRYSPTDSKNTAPMQWNFPVQNGTYEVNLYFSETTYLGGVKNVGARVFNVNLEGKAVLTNFDIYAEGQMNAVKKSFTVTVSDGNLDIDFIRIKADPQVNGIEIRVAASGAGSSARTITEAGEEPAIQSTLDIYPNPFTNQINLSFGEAQSAVAVSLVDLTGRPLFQQMLTDGKEFSLDMSALPASPGVYVLIITTDKGRVERKVMKQ